MTPCSKSHDRRVGALPVRQVDLEVQVRAGRVAGAADVAELLARETSWPTFTVKADMCEYVVT